VSLTASRPSTAPAALRLERVGRRFGALVALEDVTFDVLQGERRVILGSNGAGKTTLFNTIAGDFPPTSGRIVLFGEDMTSLPAPERTRRGLRRTYQNSLLFGGLCVLDNLFLAVRGTLPGRFSLRRPAADDPGLDEAAALARRVGLEDALATPVADLSHGQQRQLELGMALAGLPRLVLLDEPAAGLSPAERHTLIDLLHDLPAEITLIMIEHDMDVALQVADLVTVMHNGRVLVEGTPDEIEANQMVHDIYMGKHGHH